MERGASPLEKIEHFVRAFFQFFDELGRVCKHDAEVEIIHPNCQSTRAFQDPTHRRFIPLATWYYLNAEWREIQGLGHYDVKCDFEIVTPALLGIQADVMNRAEEPRQMALARNWNVADDLQVIMRARKPQPKRRTRKK